jgi:hypothetical protein
LAAVFICIHDEYKDTTTAETKRIASSLFRPKRFFATTPTTTTTTTMPIHTAAAQALSSQMCPKMRKGMPSLPYIMQVAASDELAIDFLFEKGIYKYPDFCHICGNEPSKMTGKNRLQVRCSARATHYEYGFGKNKVWTESVKSGTFLSKAKLPANKFILFVYFWLGDSKLCKISQWVDIHPTTAGDWNGFLNELTTLTVTTKFDGTAGKIGGPGVIVEIDES